MYRPPPGLKRPLSARKGYMEFSVNFGDILRRLFGITGGSRSTALASILGMLLILGFLLFGLAAIEATVWLIEAVYLLFALTVVFAGGVYLYLLKKNPDLLRSESFTLKKVGA